MLPRFDRDAVRAAGGPEVLVSLVPTALARVGAEHFRTVVLGGSAPPGDLPPNVVTTYGLTETGSGVVYDGVPLAGVEVAIDAGHRGDPPAGPDAPRGPTGTARRPSTPTGGWRPATPAQLDADGRLHVDGRLSDLIITGGENVWPGPVEAALLTHPVGGRGRRRRPARPRVGPAGGGLGRAQPTAAAPPVLDELRRWSPRRSPRSPPPASWSSSTPCPARPSARSNGTCCRPP